MDIKKCLNPHENLHLYVFLYGECDGSIIFDGGRTAMRQISISTGESVIGTIQSQYQDKLYESLYTYVTLCGQHDSGTYCLVYIHCATVVGTPGHSLALHAILRDIV